MEIKNMTPEEVKKRTVYLHNEVKSIWEGLDLLHDILKDIYHRESDKISDQAKAAFENKVYKLKNTKLKRVLSESEIGKIYEDKNKLFQISGKLYDIVERLRSLKDHLEKWRCYSHIVKISLILAEEGKKHKKWERTLSQKSGIDTVKLYQKEFETVKKNMDEILKLMEPVKALAPRGVSDFLDLYFKAFSKADKGCEIVSNYANKIAGDLEKTERAIRESQKNKNSKSNLDATLAPKLL